ncbi:Uncharacterized protein PBTT_05721 [Plasmodiophora brassicae]
MLLSRKPVPVLVEIQVTAVCLNPSSLIRCPSFPLRIAFERFCFYFGDRSGFARRNAVSLDHCRPFRLPSCV